MGVEIRSLSGVMAAEAVGVDLKTGISPSERDALRQAITDHLVLCIRGQDLSPTELAEASNLFGKPKTFVLRRDRIEDAPEVSIVSNRPPSLGGKPLVQAKQWHTDDSYHAEPATLILLHAVTLPGAGGDTEFINCCAVLDALPPDMRSRIDNLRAVHKYFSRRNQSWVAKLSGEEEDETPDVDHPMVRTHPLSGRQSLYINPNRIDHILGWDEEASDALLDPLYELAFQPRFQYRHNWQPGDLVVWDNRCTMHRANADYDLTQPRVMHRVMLEGEIPQ